MIFLFRLAIRLIRTVILIALIAAIIIVIMFKGDIPGIELFGSEKTEQSAIVPQNGTTYSLENNELFKNIPLTQVKNVFNFMDKQEFMDVSGLTRLGYNDDYLIGQRGSDFLLYRFGDKNITMFKSEQDLQNQLQQIGQKMSLQEKSAY